MHSARPLKTADKYCLRLQNPLRPPPIIFLPSHPRIAANWQARAQSSLLAALQAPPYPSRVPDPLKPAPGASYKPIQSFPQIAVIRGSYPR